MNRQAKSPLLRRLLSLLRDETNAKTHYDESRRDFLKSGLILSAGISAGLTPELLHAAGQQPRVAIIGAGLAGLSCAWELRKSGIQATVYEADRRAGGRVQTLNKWPSDANWVELGAEFINTDHEAVLKLCEEFSIPLLDKQETKSSEAIEDIVAVVNQIRYSSTQIKDALRSFSSIVFSDFKQLSSSEKAFHQFDHISLAEYLDGKEIEPWFRQLLSSAFTSEFGLEADDQTCVNLIELLGETGENNDEIFGSSDERYTIQGGNSRLIEALALKMEQQIQLGVPLVAISPSGNGYQLTFKHKKPITADFVVLAVPLSQIQKIDLSKLPIPATQRAAHQEIGYGQNNKLILGFQEAFWTMGGTPSNGNAIHDQLHNLWWSTAMQQGRLATLTAFMGGSNSLSMAKILRGIPADSETPYLTNYLNEFEYAFPEAINRFNGLWQTALWTSHPFQQGSYACFKPGQISRFRASLGKTVGQIYFAGEYTSVEHQGYMNGAVESGQQTARSIMNRIKGLQKAPVKRNK